MDNDTASTDTRQSSTKPRQQGEYMQELFKTERLCFRFLCERPNYGDLKSCQSSYFTWLSPELFTVWRNIPRLFQTECLKSSFFIPFLTAKPFLQQHLTENKATAGNNCFAEADPSAWLEGFGLSLLLLCGIGQCRTEMSLTLGCSTVGCSSSKKTTYICCLLEWIQFGPFSSFQQ